MTRLGLFSLAGLVLVADQLSKYWVVQAHRGWPTDGYDYSREVIPGFFSLTYVQNTGGAFGLFHALQSGTMGLAAASVVASVVIVAYAVRARQPLPNLLAVALGGALGGALGNLIDRVRLGHVVDFLDVHIGTHQWPVFNVADSAICVGVALLALYYSRIPARTPHPAPIQK